MASNETDLLADQAQASEASLPEVAAGFHIQVHAHAEQPAKLSFAPDGTLYTGTGQGNRIFRVAPGGGQGTRFGPPQVDPDAVLFDAAGRISGVRNSVLVGGGPFLAAIFPDQTSAVIFNTVIDVDDMKFDRTGRLIFSEDAPRVSVSTGAPPVVLFVTPSRPASLAIDQDNRIFVVLADGTIRIYNPDGTAAGIFASGLATGLDTYIIFGEGAGGFGRFLYALSGSTLLRFTGNGKSTAIGSGFSIGSSSSTGFVFGPDHALYVSEERFNRILRIARGNRR
jgi:sugar lactone lactonase YvrE